MPDPKSVRRAAERILEDESLTADLAGDAAKHLVEWGLARAQAIAQQALELPQEEFDARLSDLRRAMKRVGKQAGRAPLEAQVAQVQALLAELEPEPGPQAEPEAAQPPPAETGPECESPGESPEAENEA